MPLLAISSPHGDKIIDDGDKAAAGLCFPLISLVFTSMVVDGDGDGDGDEDDDDDAGGSGGGVDAVDCMVTTLVCRTILRPPSLFGSIDKSFNFSVR